MGFWATNMRVFAPKHGIRIQPKAVPEHDLHISLSKCDIRVQPQAAPKSNTSFIQTLCQNATFVFHLQNARVVFNHKWLSSNLNWDLNPYGFMVGSSEILRLIWGTTWPEKGVFIKYSLISLQAAYLGSALWLPVWFQMTKLSVYSQLSKALTANLAKRWWSHKKKSSSDFEYLKVTSNIVSLSAMPNKSKGKQLALSFKESDVEHSSRFKEILAKPEGIYRHTRI